MNRLAGVLFHTLKGSPGWSDLAIKNIDIARVISVSHNKRLFKIFDRDKPYTLDIEYYLPSVRSGVAPSFGRHVSITVYSEPVVEHNITKRYETKELVLKEIKDINNKIKKLDDYTNKISSDIMCPPKKTEDFNKVLF